MNTYAPLYTATKATHRGRRALCLASLLAAFSACADERGPSDPDALPEASSAETEEGTLVAEISRADLTLQYHVDEEGNLLQTEVGTPDALAASHPELDPVARYEALSGEPAPTALKTAAARSHAEGDAAGADDKALFVSPIYSNVDNGPLNIGQADFRARHCNTDDRDFQFFDQTAPKSFSKSDTNYWKTGVYAATGSLYAETHMHNIWRRMWLSAGQAMTVTWWVDGGKGYRGATSVSNNSGRYDMCINYHY